MAIIAILLNSYEPGFLTVVEGLLGYRDKHALDWDVRIVNEKRHASSHLILVGSFQSASTYDELPTRSGDDLILTITGSDNARCKTCCLFDETSFPQLAAQHFAERGYRTVAVFGANTQPRIRTRMQGFLQAAQSFGLTGHPPHRGGLDHNGIDQRFIEQIRSLPGPVGLYAFIDNQGVWFRKQLLESGFSIPEQVAIVGTGDLHRSCHARMPFLNSVAFPWRLMGYEAGRCMHHVIQTNTMPERRKLEHSI